MRIAGLATVLFLSSTSVIATGQSAANVSMNCSELGVVPAIRECQQVHVIPLPGDGISIAQGHGAEEKFLAEEVASGIKDKGVSARIVPSRAAITFLNAEAPIAKRLLHEWHVSFEPAMHNEGYVIGPSTAGLAVIAESSAGLFYGAQTVKQLVRFSGKKPVLLVPTGRDWPAMPNRGLSDDWSRGPIPNMDFLKREIRTLAAFKYNIFSPYFENTFRYSSSAVTTFPGGALTREEARELVDYAARYHVTIIPEQEAFGHLHNVLRYEQFSSLGETERGAVLAPGDPKSLSIISAWFKELAEVFPAPYVHIGADETFELGVGRTREAAEKRGLDAVYIDFLKQIHDTLASNHKRLLFWGDIAVKSPDLVATLPKDMVAVPWDYDAKPDFTKQIAPFVQAGLETWVATGVNNWNRMYPDNNEALGNIANFVRDGQRLGAKGMLNTVWNDDGEGIFDQNWLGVLFGGAAAWQPGESQAEVFVSSFGLAFHNDPTGKINEAQRELMAAHAAFRKAGMGSAQDNYYWADPFSVADQSKAEKIRPILAEVRLHAERAIALVSDARDTAQRDGWKLANDEALQALELGARRIDMTALKFEAADDCTRLYAHALSLAKDPQHREEVNLIMEQIGSNNGRLQDIRDGYSLMRDLYQDAWLKDYRPYWLQNNLARYDRATQLWIGRGESWSKVTGSWYRTHTLPAYADTELSPR